MLSNIKHFTVSRGFVSFLKFVNNILKNIIVACSVIHYSTTKRTVNEAVIDFYNYKIQRRLTQEQLSSRFLKNISFVRLYMNLVNNTAENLHIVCFV